MDYKDWLIGILIGVIMLTFLVVFLYDAFRTIEVDRNLNCEQLFNSMDDCFNRFTENGKRTCVSDYVGVLSDKGCIKVVG